MTSTINRHRLAELRALAYHRVVASRLADDRNLIAKARARVALPREPPAELLVSMEADLYPKNFPERADLIDGTIGEGSPRVATTTRVGRPAGAWSCTTSSSVSTSPIAPRIAATSRTPYASDYSIARCSKNASPRRLSMPRSVTSSTT